MITLSCHKCQRTVVSFKEIILRAWCLQHCARAGAGAAYWQFATPFQSQRVYTPGVMAEQTPITGFNQKLEENITCGVCLQRYTNPKVLICHHSFCTTCIEQLPQELEVCDYYSYTAKDIYVIINTAGQICCNVSFMSLYYTTS